MGWWFCMYKTILEWWLLYRLFCLLSWFISQRLWPLLLAAKPLFRHSENAHGCKLYLCGVEQCQNPPHDQEPCAHVELLSQAKTQEGRVGVRGMEVVVPVCTALQPTQFERSSVRLNACREACCGAWHLMAQATTVKVIALVFLNSGAASNAVLPCFKHKSDDL